MSDNFDLKKFLAENKLGSPEQQQKWSQNHNAFMNNYNKELDAKVSAFVQDLVSKSGSDSKSVAHEIVGALGRLRLYDKDNRF